MKLVMSTTWMSTDASREVLLEQFPPSVLLHPACLNLPLLFCLMRKVFEFFGIFIESHQCLYVFWATQRIAIFQIINILMMSLPGASRVSQHQGTRRKPVMSSMLKVAGDAFMPLIFASMRQNSIAVSWKSLQACRKYEMILWNIVTICDFLVLIASASFHVY